MKIAKKAVRKAAEARKKAKAAKAKPEKQTPKGIKVEVVNDDALAIPGDVLALKYARKSYGVDAEVAKKFQNIGETFPTPKEGEAKLVVVEGLKGVSAKKILIVGTPGPWKFKYQAIRNWAGKAITVLFDERKIEAKHLVLTPHGAGFGLDPIKAFDSLLLGLMDSIIDKGKYPRTLERISIAVLGKEHKDFRGRLRGYLPGGFVGRGASAPDIPMPEDQEPDVFVVMPFSPREEMNALYRNILEGVRKAKINGRSVLVAGRADDDSETKADDLLRGILERIDAAKHVIVVLTPGSDGNMTNANVCFEAGYAYKEKKGQMIFVFRKGDCLKSIPSDLRGLKWVGYDKPEDLVDQIRKKLISRLRSAPPPRG